MKYKIKRVSLISLLATLLTACNGSGDSSSASGTSTDDNGQSDSSVAMFAMDSRVMTALNQSATVDLEKLVKVTDNSAFQLVSVAPVDSQFGHCGVDLQQQSFSVTSSQLDDCMLQYKVRSLAEPQVTSSAIVRVGVTAANSNYYANPELPVITHDAEVGTPITLNIRNELAAIGFDANNVDATLSSNILVIGSATAKLVTDLDDTIEFTAQNKGISQIYYSYRTADGSLFQGTVVISTSVANDNQPPITKNYTYPTQLNLGELVTVDVKELGLISDADDDSLQLIQIDGADSELSLLDAMNVDNTSFSFSSTKPGQHTVVYTVSDHQGGFSSGVVVFNVKLDFSMVQPWEDIIIPASDSPWGVDTTFVSPPSQALLDINGIAYSNIVVGDGIRAPIGIDIAQFTLLQARQYCQQRGGRLPTASELTFLESYIFSIDGKNLYNEKHWPIVSDYYSGDFESIGVSKSYDFNNRTETTLSTSGPGSTTCVLLNNDAINDYSAQGSVELISGVDSNVTATTYDPYGDVAPYFTADLTAINSKGIFDNGLTSIPVTSNDQGELNAIYHDLSFNDEELNVVMSLRNNLISYKVNLMDTSIDVTIANKDMWNVHDMNNNFPGFSLVGMPVNYKGGGTNYSNRARVAISYKQAFKGTNFVASYRLDKSGSTDYGSYSFYLQQIGANPDTWINIDNSGFPNDASTYGFQVDYYSKWFNIIEEGEISVSTPQSEIIEKPTSYVWFDKRGDKLRIYTNYNDQRPDKPVGVITVKNIDLTSDYWIGFSGFNNNPTSGTVRQLNFASFE